MKIRKFIKGFTLIELLIVIAIIGVLAVALLPTLLGAPSKARDTQRIASIQKIQAFLVDRSLTTGSVPGGTCIKSGEGEGDEVTTLIADNLRAFGGAFPSDPSNTNGPTLCPGGFGYLTGAPNVTGYSAVVWAVVENEDVANFACVTATGIVPTPITNLTELVPVFGGDNETPCFVALIE